ncbi:5'-3' exoribonuclease 1-like [Amphiura filiformis]|uniref:5'-3' exoribonuclease 1-like n=1 Tax=Amphiura filiformis TaxID=82378 RepID=UPI003B219BB5
MGVPKFYRWISERYPCLSEVVKENQIPEFDNLYLDMNGIIHPCSHPNDDDVHFRITEEKIYENIFNYIDVLFRMIKPRKVFFMAVDGVAPRAKMNQQRGRRFRSAHEAEAREKEAVSKGETLPEEKRFDSNCITPGTHFMARLNEQLKYFVNKKMTYDRSWQGVRVFLSGHETPGEGEHKIMDFIRSEKLRPDYDSNTRHCLYGLDADLIMLGLASHEPHFSLLREEVRFGKQANSKRPTTAEETTFHLLHLSLFREYLDAEFSAVRSKIVDYDAEKIIDDWVFMGFLVGNDFVPHLPDLHINHNALPLLYQTYMDVRPEMNGYLNENGTLNLANFEKYITKLAQYDRDKFEEQFVDLSFFAEKKESGKGEAWQSERVNAKKEAQKKELDNSFAVLMNLEEDPDWPDTPATPGSAVPANIPVPQDDDDDDEEEDQFEVEFRQHKYGYYMNKFGIENVTRKHVWVIAKEYVRALQWILHYYFNGIQSWGWYYPYHYAPYMSDLRDFSSMKLEFDRGEPFLPFQQLLGVLPAASRVCLPDTYQSLMIMDTSPIIDYYPVDFQQDLNGKQQAWEAVVLIPFIDEKRLLAAMAPKDVYLTDEERGRNKHSPHLMYTYDENLTFNYPSSCSGHFPDISACHARCTEIPKMAFQHDPTRLQRGLRKGVKMGVYFPGFPTLHHLEYTSELSKQEVKVFQQHSRGENMIITITPTNSDNSELDLIANNLLGKSIYAEWPHLKEVRVIAVASPNEQHRYELVESVQKGPSEQMSFRRVPMTEDDKIQWIRDCKSISETYLKRKGVKIGRTEVLVYACPLMGRRYTCGHNSVITLEKQWSSNPVTYAHHMTVKDIAVHDSTFKQFKTLEEIFPKDCECFMLGTPNYGCEGKVIEVEDGRVRVLFTIPYEPTFDHIKKKMDQYETQYFPGYQLAKRLGVSSLLVSRITGTVFMERGNKEDSIYAAKVGNRIPIGLNLKFNKANQEIPGYTKKADNGWLYSNKLEDTLREYMQKFPDLFEFLSRHVKEETYYEADVFVDDPQRIKDLQDWLKALDCSKVGKVQCGQKNMSETAVKLIEEDLVAMAEGKKKSVRKMKMFIRPHLLYRPLDHLGNLIPDPEADYQLFDRVVNVRDGYTVPLGMKGIVIGVQQNTNVLDSLYDVIFDEEFLGGLNLRCTGSRAYRMPPTALMNISFGFRKESGQHRSNRPTAVVKPQFSGGPPHSQHSQSPAYYSSMMGKLGTPNSHVGNLKYTPRNQRAGGKSGAEPATEQFYNPPPLMQLDTAPYSTPYQQTPPPDTHPSRSSSGRRSQRNNQEEAPSFTLLTKAGQKRVGQPVKETNYKSQTQERKTPAHATSKEMARPVTESSSNYASVLKVGSKTNNDGEVAAVARGQKQDSRAQKPKKDTAQQGNVVVQEADEFANLWKQLQAADSDGNSNPNTPTRNRTNQPEVVGSNKQAMQDATADIPLKPKGVTDLVVNEEDRMSPRSYAKTGTEELCRLLNISAVSEPTKDEITPPTSESSSSLEASPKSDTDATPVTPSYGVPLSVDELFSSVFPKKQQPNTTSTSVAMPGSPQPPASQGMPHGQHTVPINIPFCRQSQYPISPITSFSPQTRPLPPGLVAGSPLVLAVHTSSLTGSSSESSSTGSPIVAVPLPTHGQPRMPADPRTPPRPIPSGSQYEGSPITNPMRGPAPPHQGSPQQFRMPAPQGAPATLLRGPPMVSRGPLPPSMFAGPTYTQMLHNFCYQNRMPRPQFEFFPNPKTGTIRAAIQLPNRPKVIGPDGVNQHAAVDMVSHICLRQLDPNFGMQGVVRAPVSGPPPTHGSPRQPPPPVHGSPRQPPPPVHGSPHQPPVHGSPHQPPPPHGQHPHGSPVRGQQPIPRYPLFPMEQQMGARPIRPTFGAVGPQWQQQQQQGVPRPLMGPMVIPYQGGQSPQAVFHTAGPNPFVPLQVTRQLTPRKSESEDESTFPTSPRVMSAPAASSTTQDMLPPSEPTVMATPPRNTQPTAAPVMLQVLSDQSIVQVGGVCNVSEGNASVEKDGGLSGAIEQAHEVETKKVTSRVRRKPPKAKLAINFGGN